MAWRAAQSLTKFHQQLKATYGRAVPPATDVNSWGIIGDEDHSNTSDHSPHNFAGWANDVVTAADWPHAPGLGLDAGAVAEHLRVSKDNRIKYVIWNRRMFSSYASGTIPGYTWRTYTGSDPHTTHGHLSVVGDARADSTTPWQIGAPSIMAFFDDPNAEALSWRIDAWNSMSPVIRGGTLKGEAVPFVKAMQDIRQAIADSAAREFASAQRETAQAAQVAALTATVQALAESLGTVDEDILDVIRERVDIALSAAGAALSTPPPVA